MLTFTHVISIEPAETNLHDLQSIEGLDVEQSVETLLEANGQLFRENVGKWGAANQQPQT